MPTKFEVFKDKKGEFRFRLKAANGETIATGESYKAKTGALAGIRSIKKNAPVAEIQDTTVEISAEKKTVKKTAKAKTKDAPKDSAKPRGRPKTKV